MFKIISKTLLAPNIWEMVVENPRLAQKAKAGQFLIVMPDENGEPGTPAMMDDCPRMQGEGFFLRNAGQVRFEGVRVVGVKGDLMNIDGSVRMENQA